MRNTKTNLELIEAWLDALIQREVKKSVNLTVLVAEMKGDLVKQMNNWLQPSTEKVDATQTPATTESPPPTVLRQFILSGIFTQPQFEKLMKRLRRLRCQAGNAEAQSEFTNVWPSRRHGRSGDESRSHDRP